MKKISLDQHHNQTKTLIVCSQQKSILINRIVRTLSKVNQRKQNHLVWLSFNRISIRQIRITMKQMRIFLQIINRIKSQSFLTLYCCQKNKKMYNLQSAKKISLHIIKCTLESIQRANFDYVFNRLVKKNINSRKTKCFNEANIDLFAKRVNQTINNLHSKKFMSFLKICCERKFLIKNKLQKINSLINLLQKKLMFSSLKLIKFYALNYLLNKSSEIKIEKINTLEIKSKKIINQQKVQNYAKIGPINAKQKIQASQQKSNQKIINTNKSKQQIIVYEKSLYHQKKLIQARFMNELLSKKYQILVKNSLQIQNQVKFCSDAQMKVKNLYNFMKFKQQSTQLTSGQLKLVFEKCGKGMSYDIQRFRSSKDWILSQNLDLKNLLNLYQEQIQSNENPVKIIVSNSYKDTFDLNESIRQCLQFLFILWIENKINPPTNSKGLQKFSGVLKQWQQLQYPQNNNEQNGKNSTVKVKHN